MRLPSGAHRIRYKLMGLFVSLTLFLLFAVIAITYGSSADVIKEQSVQLNNKLVELGDSNLNSALLEVDKVFQSLYINAEFKKYLADWNAEDAYDSLNAYTSLKNLLHSLVNFRRDIYSIIYVDDSGVLVYSTRKEAGYEAPFDRTRLPDWIQQAVARLNDNPKERLILPSHEHPRLSGNPTSSPNEYVVTIARRILNVESDFAPVGLMLINMDLSTPRALVNDIKPYPNAITYIAGGDGTIVMDSSERNIGGAMSPEIVGATADGQGHLLTRMDDRNWMAVYTTSALTGWKIINFIPESEYSANVSSIKRIVLEVCLLAAIFSILLIFLVSRYFSRPIERLSTVMKRIDLGNMGVRAEVGGRDEIGLLAHRFNTLISRLQSAIANEYEARLRQNEAELKALQAQIHPHFLYNVLQSISGMALMAQTETIGVMAKALGGMLRYSMRTDESLVTVGEECDHAERYLAIQKIRFPDKMDYAMHVPGFLRNYAMLRLTLQPIVENAVQHGFEEMDGGGYIGITGYLEGEWLHLIVSDNGKGMSPRRLETLFDDKAPGIGLKNVRTRLRLCYGDRAELSIESEEQVGTSVKIRFPAEPAKGDTR